MIVRDIMTPDPSVVTPGELIANAAALMRDLEVGAIPVVEDLAHSRLIGIITDRDIAVRCTAAGHPATCVVRDHMSTTHLTTVGPDDDVHVAIARMEEAQVRRLPVVDAGERVIGIVAQADLAARVGPTEPQLIEQLVHDISAPGKPLPV